MCGPLTGGDWVGVRFPTLAITPYTMNLVASVRYSLPSRLGITGGGPTKAADCAAL